MLSGFLGHHQDPQMSPGSPSITGVPWCHHTTGVPCHLLGPLALPVSPGKPLALLGSPGITSVFRCCQHPWESVGSPGVTGVSWHHWGPQASPGSLGITQHIHWVPKHPWGPQITLQFPGITQGIAPGLQALPGSPNTPRSPCRPHPHPLYPERVAAGPRHGANVWCHRPGGAAER